MTPATSSSTPSPNGETDMNDIDIEEAAQLRARLIAHAHQFDIFGTALAEDLVAAAAMFDAIETGRQWETIARRLAEELGLIADWVEPYPAAMASIIETLAAFRDLADRTPTPHHDGDG